MIKFAETSSVLVRLVDSQLDGCLALPTVRPSCVARFLRCRHTQG